MYLLGGGEVDVRGALLYRLGDDRLHELHDRCVGRGLAQVGHLGDRRAVVLHDVLDALREAVEAPDEQSDVVGGGNRGDDLESGHQPDVVDGEDVGRIGHGHEQRARPLVVDRDRAQALGHGRSDEVGGRHVDLVAGEVDVVEAEALGHHASELVGGERPALEQNATGRLARGARGGHRRLDPLPRGEAEVGDHVADQARRAPAPRGRRQPGLARGGSPGGGRGDGDGGGTGGDGAHDRSPHRQLEPTSIAPCDDLLKAWTIRCP